MDKSYVLNTTFAGTAKTPEWYDMYRDGEKNGATPKTLAQEAQAREEKNPIPHFGFTLFKPNEDYHLWALSNPEGVPEELSGTYSSQDRARAAIDLYVASSREVAKTGKRK
jgi:hypothetical protein